MFCEIESAENGYIIRNSTGIKSIFPDLISVFNDLLLRFESKSEHFVNDSYAKVRISYKDTKKDKKYVNK